MRKVAFGIVGLAVAGAVAVGAWSFLGRNPASLSLCALGQVAGEAYIYAYPLLVMDQTRATMLAAPETDERPSFALNHLSHIRDLPSYGDETVVRPNLDTLYSIAWLDLSEGPVVLRWPEMGERYWLFQVMDAWTDVAGAPGTRTQGAGPGAAMISGPGWDGPALPGMVHIEVETNMAWIIGRIAVRPDGADLEAVHALQDRFSLTGPEIGATPTTSPALAQRPPDVIADLSADEVFSRLARLIEANPPRGADEALASQMRALGVRPGERSKTGMGWISIWVIDRGVTLARQRLAAGVAARPYGPTGWRTLRSGVGDYRTDYGLRAGVALIGLGANLPEDAIYPTTDVDAQGIALDGRFDYRIRFEPDGLPPAGAFWSITAYDADGFLMDTMTPAHISHRDLFYDADGGATLIIGAPRYYNAPANHLPVAPEPFQLTARLYLPGETALSGDWEMPPVVRIAG